MTLKQNTAEGGTSGTAITSSSQTGGGSGDQLTKAGTPTTLEFSNTHVAHGSEAYHMTYASGSGGVLLWQGYTATSIAARYYSYLTAIPSATSGLLGIYNGSGLVAALYVDSSGHLQIQSVGGTSVFTSTATISANTLYRFELVAIAGTTTSNGTIMMACYAGDSTTAVSGLSYSSGATVNTGTASLINAQFGKMVSSTAVYDQWLDDLAVNDGATTFIGPPAVPPTAAFSVTGYAGLQVSVDGTASVANAGGATLTGYSWAFGDSGTGTGSTTTHTYSTAGTYTITLTVTDSNGQTNPVSHSFQVYAPAGNVVSYSVPLSTGWTGGTLPAVISDGDSTTFMTSSASPSSQEFDSIPLPLIAPSSGFPMVVAINADYSGGGSSGSVVAKLYEGAVLKSTSTPVALSSGSGSSVTPWVMATFPWSDISGIASSSWINGNLTVKLFATAS